LWQETTYQENVNVTYFHDLTDFAVGFGFAHSTDGDISGNIMGNNPYVTRVYGWWLEGGLVS